MSSASASSGASSASLGIVRGACSVEGCVCAGGYFRRAGTETLCSCNHHVHLHKLPTSESTPSSRKHAKQMPQYFHTRLSSEHPQLSGVLAEVFNSKRSSLIMSLLCSFPDLAPLRLPTLAALLLWAIFARSDFCGALFWQKLGGEPNSTLDRNDTVARAMGAGKSTLSGHRSMLNQIPFILTQWLDMLDQVVLEMRAATGTRPREYFTQVLKLPFQICTATAKPCYSYCLIDARFWTATLHAAAASGAIADTSALSSLSSADSTRFNIFADSIFCVGKGTGGRLSSHLSPQKVATGAEARYDRIRAIFEDQGSVIFLRVVDGVRTATAHNSEALLMTALATMKAHLIPEAVHPRVDSSKAHLRGCVPHCACLTNLQSPHWNLERNTHARKLYRYSGADAQKRKERLALCMNELFRAFRVFLLTPYHQLKMRHAAEYAPAADDDDVPWDDSGYQTARSIVNSSSDEDEDEDENLAQMRETFNKMQKPSAAASSSSSSTSSSAQKAKSKPARNNQQGK